MNIYFSLTLIFLIPNLVFCGDVIEVSHKLWHDSPYFMDPGAEPFSSEIIESTKTNDSWMRYGKFCAMEHQGTFVVAPYSLYESGRTVDQIPLKDLFGNACVINITDKVANNNLYELSAEDVRLWVSTYGAFVNCSIILINTGWEKGRYPNQLQYFGDDKGSNFIFPGVSYEGMEKILSYEVSHNITIVAFGIDTPKINTGGIYNVGKLCSSKNKYGIRNMKDLDKLPTLGAKLIVAPMKIKNGAGAPARVFAQLP